MRKRVWPNEQARRCLINYFTIEDYGNGFKLFKWYRIVITDGVVVSTRRNTEKREYSLSHRPLILTEEDFEPLVRRTRNEENRHKAEQIAYLWPMETTSYFSNNERRI
jgi:hypothetical protein